MSKSSFIDLRFAASDAIQFSREFRAIFETTDSVCITDSIDSPLLPTRSKILLELHEFLRRIERASVNFAIFFFSGHGFQTEGNFVFCCRDFEKKIPDETGIKLKDIFRSLRVYGGRKIIVFDCCRSYYEATEGQFSQENILPQISSQISLNETVLFACQPGQTSIEVGSLESNFGGIFVNELVSSFKHCSDNYYEFADAFESVKQNVSEVAAEYDNEQNPTFFGADLNEVVIPRKKTGSVR